MRNSKRKYQAKYVKKGEHSNAQARYMETDKYQKTKARYIETGKHGKAQAKYEQKFKRFCKVCPARVVKPRKPFTDEEWKSSKILKHLPQSVYNKGDPGYSHYQLKSECKCPPVDRESYLQVRRTNLSKHRNRNKVRCGCKKCRSRLKSFMKLCLDTLRCLKRGRIKTNRYYEFNKFHLVEGELGLENNTDDPDEDEYVNDSNEEEQIDDTDEHCEDENEDKDEDKDEDKG